MQNDIDGHYPHFDEVISIGRELVDEGHPQADSFQRDIDDLLEKWDELTLAAEERKHRLELSETAQQVSSHLGYRSIVSFSC